MNNTKNKKISRLIAGIGISLSIAIASVPVIAPQEANAATVSSKSKANSVIATGKNIWACLINLVQNLVLLARLTARLSRSTYLRKMALVCQGLLNSKRNQALMFRKAILNQAILFSLTRIVMASSIT